MKQHIEAAICPLSDALISGEWGKAVGYFKELEGPNAVRLLLAAFCRSDAVIEQIELNGLAEFMGVFTDVINEADYLEGESND